MKNYVYVHWYNRNEKNYSSFSSEKKNNWHNRNILKDEKGSRQNYILSKISFQNKEKIKASNLPKKKIVCHQKITDIKNC